MALLVALLTLPLAWGSARAAPSAEAAQTLIEQVGGQVLEILNDPAASDQQKYDRLVEILDAPIDLDLVGRLILGKNWRIATPEQQTEYLELFRAYALSFLASKLHLYSGQEFAIASAQMVNERDALVSTDIISDGRPPVRVDWRLRENPGGDMVAIDVVVEGVSLVVTQRSEFGSVIERQGFDGLLAELRRRAAERA